MSFKNKREEKLDDDQIIDFLSQVKYLHDSKSDERKLNELAPSANAICGTIAVLVCLHRDWLRENRSEEEWCIEKLLQILNNPPKRPEFDYPKSFIDYTWEHFTAEAAPLLWAEQPENKTWRQIVAQLVTSKHYNTSSIVINRAFENRHALGRAFWELVNITLDWAVLRFNFYVNSSSLPEKDIKKSRKKVIKKFVSGKYTDIMAAWGEDSTKSGNLRVYGNLSKYYSDIKGGKISPFCHETSLDIEQIQHTFADVFLPDQSADQEERDCFIKFWYQAMITALTYYIL